MLPHLSHLDNADGRNRFRNLQNSDAMKKALDFVKAEQAGKEDADMADGDAPVEKPKKKRKSEAVEVRALPLPATCVLSLTSNACV